MFLLVSVSTNANQRIVYTINDVWKYHQGECKGAETLQFDDQDWDIVHIPHTWNNIDGDDEMKGYYRGVSWYRKNIYIDNTKKNYKCIIYFEGANQELSLYVNGKLVGEHKGGYTGFCFDITEFLDYGHDNTFAISLSNKHNKNIPPLSADFTFHGGIYRDVYLKFINPVHISVDDYASSGVYFSTPSVSEEEAVLSIKSKLTNSLEKKTKVILENVVCDANGTVVIKSSDKISLKEGETVDFVGKDLKIKNPHLWDTDTPYLYRVYTRVIDAKTNELLDEVSNPLGLRWFSFDPEKGFFLNGKHKKLIGTARHQDYYKLGNALRDEMHVRDVVMLKNMGGNFLRISHYPQDPVILEMCDKLGIVASVEIPIVNQITQTEEFTENCVNMTMEMLRQCYNHPSVMIWAYMNEILLRCPKFEDEKLNKYFKDLENLAIKIENIIRKEDPARYTMMAYHNNLPLYEKANLTDIPMIQGWNLYEGWYEPNINNFQRMLDSTHEKYKDKIIMVSEYGPGVDPRLHSFSPQRFDFSQEYGIVFHNHHLKKILERDYIAIASVWNFNDFYSEHRVDAVPHVNNKGLVGLNREIKDVYCLYKANLFNKPYLSIGNREWKNRAGAINSADGYCVQQLPVFSNLKKVELIANGTSLGEKNLDGGYVLFDVPFIDGENKIEAIALDENNKIIEDVIFVDFQLVGKKLDIKTLEKGVNIMLGSTSYFEDRDSKLCWIPEQEYKEGEWGFIGGEQYKRLVYRQKTGWNRMYGSDKDIFGTDMNPIFQTQRVGIEKFKADIPDGNYSVYLYWSQLETKGKSQALVYNLGANNGQNTELLHPVFDVNINGTTCLKNFDIIKQYGYQRAVIKKFDIIVRDGKGLNIEFTPVEGKTMLNAIRIYRK